MSKFICALIVFLLLHSTPARAIVWNLEGELVKEGANVLFTINPGLKLMKSYVLQVGSSLESDLALIESGVMITACLDGDDQPKVLKKLEPLLPSQDPTIYDSIEPAKAAHCD